MADLPGAGSRRYDCFISYAHEDRARVQGFDRALRDLLRRRFRRWGFNTFRDETTLAVGHGLNDRLRRAMDESEWLVVVLTDEATGSPWVDWEIEYWCLTCGRSDRMIIVKADDTVDLAWDHTNGRFREVGRLPRALVTAVGVEPAWVNAVGAVAPVDWRNAAIQVAATIRGRRPVEIAGEEHRLHRRRRRVAWGAVVALTVLTVASVLAGGLALRSSAATREALLEARRARQLAEVREARALAQQARAMAPREPALALAVAAEALARLDSPVTTDALQSAHLAYGLAAGHLLHTFKGHASGVGALDISPDGLLVATASDDKTAKLWDTETGDEVATLAGHTDLVTDVEFSPDGKLVATASWDQTARLWDVTTGDELATLPGWDQFGDVRFSTDGTVVALASAGGVRLWNVATQKEIATLQGGGTNEAAFNVDGSRIATLAELPGRALLWDSATGALVQRDPPGFPWEPAPGSSTWLLDGTGTWRSDVAVNRDRTRFAYGDNIRFTTVVHDRASGKVVATMFGHRDEIVHVAFSPQDPIVASASSDGTAKIWDMNSGATIATLEGHEDGVADVEFSSDGRLIATAGWDGTAKLWSLRSGEATAFTGHTGPIGAAAFGPDGGVVATAGEDSTVKLWDPVTGRETRTLSGHRDVVNGVAFNADTSRVASASEDGTARLWDPATGRVVATLEHYSFEQWDYAYEAFTDVAFSADGTRVAAARRYGVADIYDGTTGRRRRHVDVDRLMHLAPRVPNFSPGLTGVALSPEGSMLATVGDKPTVGLTDLAGTRDDDASSVFGFHKGDVTDVAFNPDGTQLATSSTDDTAKLWDTATGTEITTFEGHTGDVTGVAFSPDGTRLVTSSMDDTAKLWDADTGTEITTFEGHTGDVTSVAFSPDGTHVVTTGVDGVALVRRIVLTPAEACAVIRHEVTEAQLVSALGGAQPRACTDLPRE